MEACESCKRYVKSIELTVDARRVPEIDDPGGAVAGPMSPGDQRLEHGFAGLYAPRRPLL